MNKTKKRSASFGDLAEMSATWYDDVMNLKEDLKEKIAIDEAMSKAKEEIQKGTEQLRNRKEKAQRKWRGLITGDENGRIRDHLKKRAVGVKNEIKNKARKGVEAINTRRKVPKNARLIDKIVFTAGVVGLWICQYVLLLHPDAFWRLFVTVIPSFFVLKLLYYRTKGWQYFLFDFCYYTNIICVVFVVCARDQVWLMKTAFIFANGPVAWAVPVWAVQLVFHDFDKVNTTYIHVMPMLLLFTIRWAPCPSTFPTIATFLSQDSSPPEIDMGDLMIAISVYCTWQTLYLIATEVLLGETMSKNPNLLTSLRYLTQNKKNGMHQLVKTLCRKLGIFGPTEEFDYRERKTLTVFCTAQFVYTLFTVAPTALFFRSRIAHLVFCFFVGIIGVFNGASFYIEVFSVRYQETNERRWQEHLELQSPQRATNKEWNNLVANEQEGSTENSADTSTRHSPSLTPPRGQQAGKRRNRGLSSRKR